MITNIANTVEEIIKKAELRNPRIDKGKVFLAAQTAYIAHLGMKRETGEPYILHPLAVGKILAELGVDEDSIIAGFLHDVLEEGKNIDISYLRSNFGEGVAELVEGVTKLLHTEREYFKGERKRAENIRKIILAMAKDIRVIFIKLADRLHNMQTLYALPPEKRREISLETLQVFAPLANRLGIWDFKWRLEDLAFQYLYPEEFENLKKRVEELRRDREEELQEASLMLKARLEEAGIEATISGRAKHLWSIYKKMQRDNLPLEDIYDLVALRVIVYTKEQCYLVLSIVHDLWTPIPGMFTDFIAMPKPNGYRSLHTKVIGPRGKPLEVQIRTWDMHREAEFGLAAHWHYKEDAKDDKYLTEKIRQLRSQIFTWQSDYEEPVEFFRSVVNDLFADRVFVITPKGDVFDLPAGSTPVDFAYHIHTEIGNRCVGAKVNDRIVPLDYVLQTGDKVEIITKPSAQPSLEWLRFLKTSHAKSCVKRFFRQKHKEEEIERGKDLLQKELAGISLPPNLDIEKELQELAPRLGFASSEDLLASIGYGATSPGQVIEKIKRKLPPPPPSPPEEEPIPALELGLDGLPMRRAKCCYPLPGEEVVGYISRGRGIVIHRANCPNIDHLPEEERERLVKINWNKAERALPVSIQIKAWDRIGLLSDISAIISSEGINISSLKVRTFGDGTAVITAFLDIYDKQELNKLMGRIASLSDVLDVYRIGAPSPRKSESSHPKGR